MGERRYQAAVAKGVRHLRFVIELCRDQMQHGGYFLSEHPAYASSWMADVMVKLIKHPKVGSVLANMCRFGMETTFRGSHEKGLVY